MSDPENQSAPEHDNEWLKPYLNCLQAHGGTMAKADTDEAFVEAFKAQADEGSSFPGASKIRQTLYISKMARTVGDDVVITEKGREFITAE